MQRLWQKAAAVAASEVRALCENPGVQVHSAGLVKRPAVADTLYEHNIRNTPPASKVFLGFPTDASESNEEFLAFSVSEGANNRQWAGGTEWKNEAVGEKAWNDIQL